MELISLLQENNSSLGEGGGGKSGQNSKHPA